MPLRRKCACPEGVSLALFALLAVVSPSRAAVSVPALFSAHAVLQRDARVPLWGRAAPGETVTVQLGDRRAATTADTRGRWRVELDLARVSVGPHELVISGTNRLVVPDVVVGEVWLCAGQSNMEWALAATKGAATELARPANPRLRQFQVRRTGPAQPAEDCDGQWVVAGPATAGRFTAVGYHFGRRIEEELGTPVGLLNVGAGGTPIEGWMSPEAIARDAAWQAGAAAAERQERDYPARLREYAAQVEAWFARHGRRDRPAAPPADFASPGMAELDWETITLPGEPATADLPAAGALWLRRHVAVPEHEDPGLERGFLLSLGVIHGADTVYWDGVRIGSTDFRSPGVTRLRRYVVPQAQLKRGATATLAIRIFQPDGRPGLVVPRDPPLVAGTVPLDGPWLAKVEYPLPAAAAPLPPLPVPPARPRGPPSRQFNGLIAPLLGAALRGFLWYQGESSAPRAAAYADSFRLLLTDWRTRWGRGELPCYFVQLPGYGEPPTEPGDSDWAELREAQGRGLALSHTGMAVAIDLGEEFGLHPRRKREVGERLARLALARTYGRPVVAVGPRFVSAVREGAALRVHFSDAHGGLVARPLPARYAPDLSRPERLRPLVRRAPAGELEGFALCGDDGRWAWAAAVIAGDSVVVSAPDIPAPTAVRYAWAGHPWANLANGAGLPAAPFRTDSLPLTTTAAALSP